MTANLLSKISQSTKGRFALEVAATLRRAGFEALLAGGCVRDLLLGLTPKDFDVATSATPDDVVRLFRRTFLVGESFGVVRILDRPGIEVETATFRSDGAYIDGRRPTNVRFTTAREDAERRDFTINAMFFEPEAQKLLDYVGGRQDLAAGVLRAVGDARQRFAEDKLRLLRCVRFAARFDFAIDAEAKTALTEMAAELTVVSAERIQAELRLILQPPTRTRAMRLLQECGLFPAALPDLADPASEPAAWNRTMRIMGFWQRDISFPLAMAGLLELVDDLAADVADKTMRRLRASNDDRLRTAWLVQRRDALDGAGNRPPSQTLRLFAQAGRDELLDLHEARQAIRGAVDDNAYCREWLARLGAVEIDPPPLVTGQTLIDLGLDPGPKFKRILDAARDAQLDGAITTKEQAVEFALRWLQADAESRE